MTGNKILFFCVATLAAMTREELKDLIDTVSGTKADFAFVEPDLSSGVENTIPRSPLSYFHNYIKDFSAAGYSVSFQNNTNQKTHYDLMTVLKGHAPEVWRFWYAEKTADVSEPESSARFY